MPSLTITAASTSQFFARILAPRNADTLSPPDLDAKRTLQLVCAILDSGDGVSVAGYPSVRIHTDFVPVLRSLPEFSRVAHIEPTKDFYTGEITQRLWLLSDWLDSEAQRKEREKYYANASREWIETRYRFWRVACRLKHDAGLGREVVCTLLRLHYDNLRAQDAATMRMLDMLGYGRELAAGEVNRFHQMCPPALGHLYDSPVDFYEIPFLVLKEYDNNTNSVHL